jgi:hypothetical protein
VDAAVRQGALACGACGGVTRGAVDATRVPAFLCRACGAVNVFAPGHAAAASGATPSVTVHLHAQERTAAGLLHYVTVRSNVIPAAAATPSVAGAAGAAGAGGTSASQACVVSYPVINAARKVVVGLKEEFAPVVAAASPSGQATRKGSAAAAMASPPRRGWPQVARLPAASPPLCVRLGTAADVAVFVQRGGGGAVEHWERVRDWLRQEQLPAVCGAAAALPPPAAAARTQAPSARDDGAAVAR